MASASQTLVHMWLLPEPVPVITPSVPRIPTLTDGMKNAYLKISRHINSVTSSVIMSSGPPYWQIRKCSLHLHSLHFTPIGPYVTITLQICDIRLKATSHSSCWVLTAERGWSGLSNVCKKKNIKHFTDFFMLSTCWNDIVDILS